MPHPGGVDAIHSFEFVDNDSFHSGTWFIVDCARVRVREAAMDAYNLLWRLLAVEVIGPKHLTTNGLTISNFEDVNIR